MTAAEPQLITPESLAVPRLSTGDLPAAAEVSVDVLHMAAGTPIYWGTCPLTEQRAFLYGCLLSVWCDDGVAAYKVGDLELPAAAYSARRLGDTA